MMHMISKFALAVLDKVYALKESFARYYNHRFEMKTAYWKDKDVHKRKSDNF